ncbi:MAG: hypothetical protein KGL16_05900 [Acidobacteriota bacterium]|nr:hypothetical protein [Acidobacteriota bacterium]
MSPATRVRARLVLVGCAAMICGTAALGIGCSAAAAATAAAATRGSLSAAEYAQLSAASAALNRSASAKTINWSAARAACDKAGVATALLRSQRASCLDSITVLEALQAFPAEERRCNASRRTTTATATTTPGTTTADAALIRLMVCLSPRYQALDRHALALYRADIAARRQAVGRGLSGACLATLASTPAALGKEHSFATSTAKLAADITLLIRVTEGKTPASAFDQARIARDARVFERAATAVLAQHAPQRLSTCPHA